MAYGKVSFIKVIPQAQQILEQNSTILATLTDVSRWYVKGSNTVDFPVFAGGDVEDIAFAVDYTDEDPNTSSDSMSMTNKIGGTFSLNDHIEHQNVLDSEELALQNKVKKIGIKASNKALASLISGAAAANNVAEGASDTMVDNIIAHKLKLEAQGLNEQLYYAPKATDLARLQKELFNTIRFDTDKTGIMGEVLGVKIVKCSDVPSSIHTASVMYAKGAVAYCWGPEFRFKRLPGEHGDRILLDRAFNCKALQSGKLISKLVNYVAPVTP